MPYTVWCVIRLVERQEGMRRELVQSILAYVGLASFLTYRDGDGFVRYMVWLEDRHLNYVMGLHAAHTDLGGIEVRPAAEPPVLGECDHVWDMEMAGYGGAPLPLDTGKRSATAALGTQITDAAYRLLVCHRVAGSSQVVAEWERSGGRPVSLGRKIAGMAAREVVDFLASGDDDAEAREPPAKAKVKAKAPPHTHMRIILGASSAEHLAILRDTFPAGSLRRRGALRTGDVAGLATIPPKVTHGNAVHFPAFNDSELAALEILPTAVTEVPMEYGRPITTTTQPPTAFVDLVSWVDDSVVPDPEPLFLPEGDDWGADGPGAADSGAPEAGPGEVPAADEPRAGVAKPEAPGAGEPESEFPVRVVDGEPEFPVRIIPG